MNLLRVILIFLLIVASGAFRSNEILRRLLDGSDSEEKISLTDEEILMILERRYLAAQRELAEAGNSKPEAQNSMPVAQNLMPESGNSMQGSSIIGNTTSAFSSENSPNHSEHPEGLGSMTENNYPRPTYNAAGNVIPVHNYKSFIIPSSYPENSFSIPSFVAMDPRHTFSPPVLNFRGRNDDIQQTQVTPDHKSLHSQPGSIISGMPSEVSYDGIGNSFMSAEPVMIINGNSGVRFYPSNQGMDSEHNNFYSQPVSRITASGMPSDVSDGGIRNFFMNTDPLMASNGNSRARIYPSIQEKNLMNTGPYISIPGRIEMAPKNADVRPLERGAMYRMDSGESNMDAAPSSVNLGLPSDTAKIQLSQKGKYSFLMLK